MENKITIQTQSDVTLNNFGVTFNKKDDIFNVTSSITDTSLNLEIATEKNKKTESRDLVFDVTADYIDKYGKTKNVNTPFITIEQYQHPLYFSEGKSSINKTEVGEQGDTVIVSTYAKQDGDAIHKVINADYFSLGISGDCVYRVSEPIETDEELRWKISIDKNLELSPKTLTVVVHFDDDNDSIWSSSEMIVTQNAHVPVIGGVVFNATPMLVEYTGGTVNIDSYYTVDGVVTPLGEISPVECSGFTGLDYTITTSGTTRTMRIKENESPATAHGEPNKTMKLKAKHPLGYQDLVIGPIEQKTQQQGIYVFNFTDGSLDKTITTPFSYEAQAITIGIVSSKNGKEIRLKWEASNKEMFGTISGFSNSVLTLVLSENLSSDSYRNSSVTIWQFDKDSPMPPLTLYLSQTPQHPKDVLPSFDYMIVTLASDFLSGVDMDMMVYAPDMPLKYQYNECVGYGAAEYLKDKFKNAEINFNDKGDISDNTLRWSGDDRKNGLESVLIMPNKFLTEEFITQQLKKGEEYFNIDIYGNFRTDVYTGVSTIKLQAYKSDSEVIVINSPYIDNFDIFQPNDDAKLVFKDVYNVHVTSGGTCSGFTEDYTQIATLRYNYANSIWELVKQAPTINPTDIEKEKERIGSIGYKKGLVLQDNSNLQYTPIFGRMYDYKNKTYYNFFNVGAVKSVYIDDENYQGHEFRPFEFYYDQTLYQMRKVAITDGTEPKEPSSEEHRANKGFWQDKGEDVYKNPGFTWSVNYSEQDGDVFWVSMDKTGKDDVITGSTIERMTYHIIDNGDANRVKELSGLTGIFEDIQNGKQTIFTIEKSDNGYKKLTWIDTANGDTSSNKCLRFVELSGYDTTKFELIGIGAYRQTLGASLYLPLSQFNYYYNSFMNNVIFKWRVKDVSSNQGI